MKSNFKHLVAMALLAATMTLSSSGFAQEGGAKRLRGSLSFQGAPGEFISGGTKVFLPPDTPVRVTERNRRSLELSFATHDDWELELAVPEEKALAPGTYRDAVRYPFQEGNEPGLSLSGAGRGCNEISGEFVITKVRRGSDGRVEDFAATFTQRCDGKADSLTGTVSVGR